MKTELSLIFVSLVWTEQKELIFFFFFVDFGRIYFKRKWQTKTEKLKQVRFLNFFSYFIHLYRRKFELWASSAFWRVHTSDLSLIFLCLIDTSWLFCPSNTSLLCLWFRSKVRVHWAQSDLRWPKQVKPDKVSRSTFSNNKVQYVVCVVVCVYNSSVFPAVWNFVWSCEFHEPRQLTTHTRLHPVISTGIN